MVSDVTGAFYTAHKPLEGVLSFTRGMVAARYKETVEALIKKWMTKTAFLPCWGVFPNAE